MIVRVSDIIRIMEEIAPAALAEEWDNVGLQIGQRDWPVKKIRVALDPTPEVVSQACSENIDVLITHHPLFFKPIKKIDFDTPVGRIIAGAANHQMALFAAHTNMDSAANGLNDALALQLGIKETAIMEPSASPAECKLVVYVPADHKQAFLNTLFETTAGKIGDYANCSFMASGQGTFKPGATSQPYSGIVGKVNYADEFRVETIVSRKDLPQIVNHLIEHHPYETMAYDVYPLLPQANAQGLGRVGDLHETMPLEALARYAKTKLKVSTMRVVGKLDMIVQKVAICTGSGASLLPSFFNSGADVFVTGDLRYHDARMIEEAGKGGIDIGHFESEYTFKEIIADRLRQAMIQKGIDVRIDVCNIERTPFQNM